MFALGQAVTGPSYPAWAVKKGNTELLALMNDFLAKQRASGTTAELEKKWFGKPFDKLPTILHPAVLIRPPLARLS